MYVCTDVLYYFNTVIYFIPFIIMSCHYLVQVGVGVGEYVILLQFGTYLKIK